ncbi:MAG TPA: amidohydrolase family protein [Bryobacteraceae bacterium]|nr:amidohydrolase family protein [Bryobacteraceae bacterium]
MKIDVFNHIFPRRFFDEFINVTAGPKDIGKRVRNIQTIVDLDARFRVMDEFGDYRQLISLPLPPLETIAGPDRSPLLARAANDGLADLIQRYPARFPSFVAALPMNNPAEAEKEAERAVSQLGACGVQFYSNAAGKPLDADEFLPLIQELARRDVPIWIHPARGADFPDYRTEARSRYEIWWTLGWPYETSAAMARIVFSGLFDRCPGLKIITHHMGGMIPYFEGRVGYGWDQLGTRTSDEDYGALLRSMKQRPIDYFKLFYADTALFGSLAGTQCGLAFFGLDHVLFASDMPFEPVPGLYTRETIRVIENLGLTAAQKDQIYRGNAERLLNLKAATA